MEGTTDRPNRYLIAIYLAAVVLASAAVLKVILWMDGVK